MKNNWEQRTLEEVCEILDSKRIPITASKREKGKYPYYGANGIQDYVSNYIFNDELVLLAEDGGNFGSKEKPIAYRVSGKCWVNNHAHVLKPKKKALDIDFLCYSLMFYDVSNIVNGAILPKLTQGSMRKMSISLPPLQEQKQIVEKLDKAFANIDKLTEIAKQNLENSKELFNSYLNKLFTENKDWEEKKLSEIGIIQTGTTPNTKDKSNFGKDIPFIKPADFYKDGTLNYNNEGLTEKGIKESRLIIKNSILMVCIGATIGKTGYNTINVACNQQINTVTPKKDFYKFIYYSMIRKDFQNLILKGCPQTTLPIINKTNWSNLKIKLPPLQQQKQIAKILDNLQEKTKKLEEIYNKKLELAKELKQSILHKELSNN